MADVASGVSTQDCTHDRAYFTDSACYGHGYATRVSRRIFRDQCRFQRRLGLAAALARAQAAELLGLVTPSTGRHAARDRVADFVTTLALITGTTGRVVDEIRMLSRPELGEVEERWQQGTIGNDVPPNLEAYDRWSSWPG